MRWEPYFSNISYAKNSVAYGGSSGGHGISIGGAARCPCQPAVSDRARIVNRKDNERRPTRERRSVARDPSARREITHNNNRAREREKRSSAQVFGSTRGLVKLDPSSQNALVVVMTVVVVATVEE